MKALRAASTESVRHLRDVCQTGGMSGRDYNTCFYAQLANAGAEVGLNESYLRTREFCAKIGVAIGEGRDLQPIEEFVFPVTEEKTSSTNHILRKVAEWCEIVLVEREIELVTRQHKPLLKLAEA
jgi:hypothetical protein